MASRRLNASEIAAFAYCRRAWWYQQQGAPSANAELQGTGQAYHHGQARRVLGARLLRRLGYAFLLLAALAAAAYLFPLRGG